MGRRKAVLLRIVQLTDARGHPPRASLPTGHKPADTMNDTQTPAPKIEFPCANYPVKVIGDAGEGFNQMVLEVIARHAPDVDAGALTQRDSRTGRFLSVQVLITATGAEQLEAIHQDLKATGRVHMVL